MCTICSVNLTTPSHMSIASMFLGKTYIHRDMPQFRWLVLGAVIRNNQNSLLIVDERNSADSALMPYGLFVDALDAGLFSELKRHHQQ